jgi:hypothetical protein
MKPQIILKTAIVLTALTFSCLSQLATAQGNLILNGSFDTNAAGWATTNGGYGNTFGNPAGSLILFTGNTSTASQEISSLTPGQQYLISGDYSGKATGVFNVALDGIVLFQTNAAPQNYKWDSFSSYYTATSTSALLSVQANATGDFYAIDNVSMQLVPEPSAAALLLFAGGIFFYVRERFQR